MNKYYILHEMDLLFNNNVYFLEIADKWHPFVSRSYVALLFYFQTLRAQTLVNIGSRLKRLVKDLLQEIQRAFQFQDH